MVAGAARRPPGQKRPDGECGDEEAHRAPQADLAVGVPAAGARSRATTSASITRGEPEDAKERTAAKTVANERPPPAAPDRPAPPRRGHAPAQTDAERWGSPEPRTSAARPTRRAEDAHGREAGRRRSPWRARGRRAPPASGGSRARRRRARESWRSSRLAGGGAGPARGHPPAVGTGRESGSPAEHLLGVPVHRTRHGSILLASFLALGRLRRPAPIRRPRPAPRPPGRHRRAHGRRALGLSRPDRRRRALPASPAPPRSTRPPGVLGRAKGEPWSSSASLCRRRTRASRPRGCLASRLRAREARRRADASLRARHKHDPRALRTLALREGYAYAPDPVRRAGIVTELSLPDLVRGAEIWIQRGADPGASRG